MVWSCEKGSRGRNVEIGGRNGSAREKESRKTKVFGGIGSGRECDIGSKKMEENYRKADPYLRENVDYERK